MDIGYTVQKEIKLEPEGRCGKKYLNVKLIHDNQIKCQIICHLMVKNAFSSKQKKIISRYSEPKSVAVFEEDKYVVLFGCDYNGIRSANDEVGDENCRIILKYPNIFRVSISSLQSMDGFTLDFSYTYGKMTATKRLKRYVTEPPRFTKKQCIYNDIEAAQVLSSLSQQDNIIHNVETIC